MNKRPVKLYFLFFFLFVMTQSNTYANQFFEFDADGEVRVVTNCSSTEIYNKLSIYSANIQNGIFYHDKFIFFDGLFLKSINIKEGKVLDLKNLESLLPNSLPWYIGLVEGSKVVFSCYEDISNFSNKPLPQNLWVEGCKN